MTLPDYLREMKLTQVAFAARVGVSASTISRLCRGETAPEAPLVEKIVAATEGRVLPNDLFPAAMARLVIGSPRDNTMRNPREPGPSEGSL